MSTPGERPGGAADDASWQSRRREAAALHAEALERQQRAETQQARALVADFVREVTARGVAPEPLAARSYDGRWRYRTPLRGWYLRRNQSVAIGTDGEFYVLTAPGSLRARLTGVTPAPSDPPLILGKGGRDGESIDLADALARVLAGGD
ncbi:hypothetical protein [Cellulomonas aerilata]|uniref:Uncharacterized protein n=1 Tax=Cellulomonas aerilata TaxID=515326 RepID=A0A512DF10_9CELL|nr:hypothetical protein [Cellulomonas aerilata]GEO34820.1 hypothetical protein CAE01nite_25450 [Cellulomonas aerilata]